MRIIKINIACVDTDWFEICKEINKLSKSMDFIWETETIDSTKDGEPSK